MTRDEIGELDWNQVLKGFIRPAKDCVVSLVGNKEPMKTIQIGGKVHLVFP